MPRAKKKPLIGRPPIAPEARRTTIIKVMTTEAEHDEMLKAAETMGLGISVWLRATGLKEARRVVAADAKTSA